MGASRCDRILSIIDEALAGPDSADPEATLCWCCKPAQPHNGGPSGLCDTCLTKLRDPTLAIWTPPTGRTDAENPAILEGAYHHRPAATVPAPWSRCWWGPR